MSDRHPHSRGVGRQHIIKQLIILNYRHISKKTANFFL